MPAQCRRPVVILAVAPIAGTAQRVTGGNPGQDDPHAVMNTARYLPGVDAAVEGDDLAGQVGIGQDRGGEIGNLGRPAEPADRHLPAQLAGSPGSIPVPATSAGASALTVTPDAAKVRAARTRKAGPDGSLGIIKDAGTNGSAKI